MKIRVNIEDIRPEELSTLFEIQTIFKFVRSEYPFGRAVNYNVQPFPIKNLVTALGGGYFIGVVDNIVDDEMDHYGNLPYVYKPNIGMIYFLNLHFLKNKLSYALERNPHLWEYLCDWLTNDGTNLDADGADILMQYIVFGEVVYG